MISADLVAQTRSQKVKEIASNLGFEDCRIADAQTLDVEAGRLEKWLEEGRHGSMNYMENYFDLRVDPRKLVPGAKSVVVLTQNYFPSEELPQSTLKISKYAYGRDYHKVIRKKMKRLLSELTDHIGEVNGRGFVDSAPVLEKAWAQRSGIGWVGKHSNILSRDRGSFNFLAVLVLDVQLHPDDPVKDHCGTCTACVDECPTDAIHEPYKVDGSKCISYFTIELKDAMIPTEFEGKFNDWVFGCDICQDVCPWNKFSVPHQEPAFMPKQELIQADRSQWNQLELETFDSLFAGSAVKRAGFDGLLRNIRFLASSKDGNDGED
ncbi:MAG TPA: tRNA epoxyqueuosine(34) reductase QueG [Flavobacteriales bacterium]|nr:tRNA epoxyqueuosine(34) reductase QueG [Flavobacteriales bacterium]